MSKRSSKRWLIAAGLLGYVIGAFPTADLVARWVGRRNGTGATDLREVGSGNPGALNAAKVLGRAPGLAVFVGDVLKGALAATLGKAVAGDNGTYTAATASVVGHCYPAWKRFHGGKGVATSFGTTFVCMPAYAPLDLTIAAASYFLSRGQASLSSGADSQPAARTGTYAASAVFALAATYWWLAHKDNLWGPKSTVGLPLYALASSAVIALRFLTTPSLPAETGPEQERGGIEYQTNPGQLVVA